MHPDHQSDISQMAHKRRSIEHKVAVWDDIAQPDFRVLALSAAPWRSNLVVGLLDPRKKHDFHGSPYEITCPSKAANEQFKTFDGASVLRSEWQADRRLSGTL